MRNLSGAAPAGRILLAAEVMSTGEKVRLHEERRKRIGVGEASLICASSSTHDALVLPPRRSC
jgi:hypothetical protein